MPTGPQANLKCLRAITMKNKKKNMLIVGNKTYSLTF